MRLKLPVGALAKGVILVRLLGFIYLLTRLPLDSKTLKPPWGPMFEKIRKEKYPFFWNYLKCDKQVWSLSSFEANCQVLRKT